MNINLKFLDIRPKSFSIQVKLVSIFVFVVSMTVISLVGYSFYEGRKISLIRTNRLLGSAVAAKKNHIENILNEHKEVIKIIALDLGVGRILNMKRANPGYSALQDSVSGYIRSIKDIEGIVFKISVLDREGVIIASSDTGAIDLSKKEIVAAFNNSGVFIKDAHIAKSIGAPGLDYALPVRSNTGAIIGGIIIDIDLRFLNDITTMRAGMENTGEFYLVRNDLTMITPSRFIDNTVLNLKIDTENTRACYVHRDKSREHRKFFGVYNNYRDIRVVGTHEYLPELEWCLIAEIEEAEAISAVQKLRRTVACLGIFVIFIVFLLSIIIGRTIIGPIKKLVKATKEFARGNFDYQIKLRSRDELKILADSFNKTGDDLKRAQMAKKEFYRDLENKVKEKTKELKKLLQGTKKDRDELEQQKLASMNILEDVSVSQQKLESANTTLKIRSKELEELKLLGDDLSGALDIEEATEIFQKYASKIIKYSVATFLIINPMKEGEVMYSAFVNEEVSEGYINDINDEIAGYIKKEKDGELNIAYKITQNIKPRLIGEKLNNNYTVTAKSNIIYPLKAGETSLGLIHISSTNENVQKEGGDGLVNAMISAYSMSVARLHTLIRSQHSKIISLVESLSDGVIMFNTEEEIILVNPAVEEFTGLSRDGFTIDAINKLFETVDFNKIIDKALKKGKVTFIGDAFLNHNRYFEILSIPVKDNREKIVGGALIIHDITHLKEVDQMKTEFVSVASHQLRTPLTAIKLFTEMMLGGQVGKLNKNQHEYLDNIFQSTERMVRLVNDLLSLSRLESGRLKIEPQSTNLQNFIANIIEEIKPLAQVKGSKIVLKNTGAKLPPIAIDINLMRQVINNLITNAVRYSSGGKGKVEVGFSKVEDDYLIVIKDNGIGIPEKVQSKIFEKFYRADNAIKSETEGTGLGLYVSKMIVEGSGGRIWFESKKGLGTTFFVALSVKGMIKRKGDKSLRGSANEVSYS